MRRRRVNVVNNGERLKMATFITYPHESKARVNVVNVAQNFFAEHQVFTLLAHDSVIHRGAQQAVAGEQVGEPLGLRSDLQIALTDSERKHIRSARRASAQLAVFERSAHKKSLIMLAATFFQRSAQTMSSEPHTREANEAVNPKAPLLRCSFTQPFIPANVEHIVRVL